MFIGIRVLSLISMNEISFLLHLKLFSLRFATRVYLTRSTIVIAKKKLLIY